jgi:hypothetical protein
MIILIDAEKEVIKFNILFVKISDKTRTRRNTPKYSKEYGWQANRQPHTKWGNSEKIPLNGRTRASTLHTYSI